MSAGQDAAPARQGRAASGHDRRHAGTLSDRRAFVFDLDGCVWHGSVLSPGAAEVLARLHAAGRAVGFISNNSRATGGDPRRRVHALGVAFAEHVLTPLEIAGEVIAERWGLSRVL